MTLTLTTRTPASPVLFLFQALTGLKQPGSTVELCVALVNTNLIITMQEEEALQFYERLTSGTENYETITLEHDSGAALSGVEMHPVGKQKLAGVIERLPEDLFEAVEDAPDPDTAEEEFEEEGGNLSAVTEDTVGAFEDLCEESLDHDDLTPTQMRHIISELNFETLFRLGTEIINISVESTGAVRDFQKQA